MTLHLDAQPQTTRAELLPSRDHAHSNEGQPVSWPAIQTEAARPRAIHAARRGVPLLTLPPPHAVPTRSRLIASLPEDVLLLCRSALERPGSRHGRARAALASRLPPVPRGRRSAGLSRLAATQPADCETHDAFFRIRRCDAAPAERFLLGLFDAHRLLRRDIAQTVTSLPDERLAILADGLLAILAAAIGHAKLAPSRWKRQERETSPDNAGLRWIRGHQIFAVLSQGMIFALAEMDGADRSGDAARRAGAAELMADLLAASAVSLELTGDFPESYYRQTVRVGMESPFLPRGFSGLLSRDHRELVAQMKRLRPMIDRLREQAPELHARITRNLGAVYASHKHVCARFVGADQSSLLMAETQGRSAVEQIDRFGAMRLRSWAPAAETGR